MIGPIVVRLHSLTEQNDVISVTDFDVVLTLLEDIVKDHMYASMYVCLSICEWFFNSHDVPSRSVRNALRYFVSETETAFLDSVCCSSDVCHQS